MTTKFEKLSDEQKKSTLYAYAIMYAQSFLFNPANQSEEFEQYSNELTAMIDWIAKETGNVEVPYY